MLLSFVLCTILLFTCTLSEAGVCIFFSDTGIKYSEFLKELKETKVRFILKLPSADDK